MLAYQTQFRSAAALFRTAALMRAAARRIRDMARRLNARLEERADAAALRDLASMGERELRDIGLDFVQGPLRAQRASWNASLDLYRL
jgi:hypothetical protein